MHLHHHTHGGEKPAMVLMIAPPTPLHLKDAFDHALHRLYWIASLLVEACVLLRLEHLDQTLPLRAFVLTFAGRRESADGPLSLPLEK
jgi:hypothetical protein